MIIESTNAAHDALDRVLHLKADHLPRPHPMVYVSIAHRGRRHWRVPVWRRVWRWVQRRMP